MECPICFDSIIRAEPKSEDERIRDIPVMTPCGHMFHNACLLNWLNAKSNIRNCPACRRSLRRQDVRRMCISIAKEDNKMKANKAKKCFIEAKQLSNDYNKLQNAYNSVRYQLAVLQGENTSLQSFQEAQESRIRQQKSSLKNLE